MQAFGGKPHRVETSVHNSKSLPGNQHKTDTGSRKTDTLPMHQCHKRKNTESTGPSFANNKKVKVTQTVTPKDTSVLPTRDQNSGQQIPPVGFEGNILYIVEPQAVSRYCEEIRERARKNSFNCVGLDVEWKPNFRKGQPPNKAALLQICPDGEKCYVFHIFHIVRKLGHFPPSLEALLQDHGITKVGEGVDQDLIKIDRDYGVSMREAVKLATVNLSRLANEVLHENKFHKNMSFGLANLSNEVLKKRFIKRKAVTMSNWQIFPLNKQQLSYAASDAYVSLLIYEDLMRTKQKSSTPV